MINDLDDVSNSLDFPMRSGTDRSPSQIEQQVLDVSARASADTLAAALDASDWLMARSKGIAELVKRVAIDWIERNGPLTVGNIQYTVGYTTTTKCTDLGGCGHELLRIVGGDFDQYLKTLVSQPYKYGTVASLMDKPVYRSFFSTKTSARLINGVPEQCLAKANVAFLGQRRGR